MDVAAVVDVLTNLITILSVAHSVVPSPDELRLSDAIAEATEQSPGVVAAKARVVALNRRVDAAGVWGDPFVAIGPDQYEFGSDPPMLRYQVSEAIPLPGKLEPRVASARARARAAGRVVELTQRRATLAVLQLFLRGLWLDRAISTNLTQRGFLDDLMKSAESRYETGAASAHHDMLISMAERSTLLRDALALERERAAVLNQIDEMRGRDVGDDADSRHLVDDGSDDGPVPATLADALESQPELAIAAAAIDNAVARVDAAEVAALPDLVVQGMAMQSFMPEVRSNIGAMVGISVPLFYPWKQAPEIDAARAEKGAVDTDLRLLELRLHAEWAEALRAEKTARDTLALYDEDIGPSTAAALESSKTQYAAQSAPLSELLSILRAQASVDLERTAAALDVRLARARLRYLLANPPILELAPRTPTLFAPAMGSMGRSMKNGPMRSTGMGPGALPTPSLDSNDEPAQAGMGAM